MIKKKINFTFISKVIVAFGIVVALVTGFISIADKIVTPNDLVAFAKDAEKKTVETFQDFKVQQMTNTKGLQLQILYNHMEYLDGRYMDYKKQLKINPLDIDAKEELTKIKLKQRIVEQKIDAQMQID